MSVASLSKHYSRKYVENGQVVEVGNPEMCGLCEREAKTYVYYPPISDLFTAPAGIERACIRLCKSHYDQAKVFINKSDHPVPIEALALHFKGRTPRSTTLKGWHLSKDSPPVAWYNQRTATFEDYSLFEAWAKNVGVGYLSKKDLRPLFNEFLNDNPDLNPTAINLFEAYLFNKEDPIVVAAPKSSSSTMFD
jgi:hypothetical protein